MTRVRTLFTVIVPSMLAGGLLFGAAFGHAAGGRDDLIAFWPAASDVTASDTARRAPPPRTAQRPRLPAPAPRPPAPPINPFAAPPPPAPPAPPVDPYAPLPPKAHKHKHGQHGGVTIRFNNGRLDISGIDGLVRGQLEGVREMLRNNPNLPRHVRDRALARLDKVKAVLERRLGRMKGVDLDDLEDHLEEMGEEIEAAMEGLEEELEQLGQHLGKDFAKQVGKNFGPGNFKFDFDFDGDSDHDSDDDADSDDDLGSIPMTPDLDSDDGDLADAISDLRDLALQPGQRDQIARLRIDSDRSVALAKLQLDDLSSKLETALADARTTDSVIARYVDQISAQEAAIRKARILAWVNARRVLDETQRRKIEAAAKKNTR